MNKFLIPLLGLGAVGALALSSKKANASPVATGKAKTRAEWLAAISYAKGQSYEQYVRVLNDAYATGLFTQAEISAMQKAHPKFPKADPTVAAKPAPTVGERVRDALATNNPVVMLTLASEIAKDYPELAADLTAAAQKLRADEAAAHERQEQRTPGVVPPVSPSAAKKPAKKKPTAAPQPPVTYDPVEHAPSGQTRELAIELARHLTGRKKGTEDKALVERFQRDENRVRVQADNPVGLTPDGIYGLNTAMALAKYDLVPPKPLYWKGPYSVTQAQKNQWRDWCLEKAAADPARKAEWTSASKV